MTDARGVKPYNWCSTTIFIERHSTAFFLFISLNKPLKMVDWFIFSSLLLAKHYIHERSALKCCTKLYTINMDFCVSLITAVRWIGILMNDFSLMVILITTCERPH